MVSVKFIRFKLKWLVILKLLTVVLVGFTPHHNGVWAQENSLPANSSDLASKVQVETIKVKAQLTRKTIKLGEPVSLVIKAQKLKRLAIKVNLQGFLSQYLSGFVVDDIHHSDASIRVRLYALKAGNYQFKAMQAAGFYFPNLNLSVTDNSEVKINWTPPKTEVFAKQLVPWLAQVEVANAAYKVSYELPKSKKDADLNFYSEPVTAFSKNTNIHHLSAVLALPDISDLASKQSLEQPGLLQAVSLPINSPVVRVKNRSNLPWKFFAEPQTLSIKPLPSFLPVNAVVGNVSLETTDLTPVIKTQELGYWRWHLKADNVSSEALRTVVYDLLAQLNLATNMVFLTESMTSKQYFTKSGLSSEVEVNIPYRVNHIGAVKLPALAMQIFNPQTTKVQLTLTQNHYAIAMPAWLIWLGWLLVGLLSFYIGIVGFIKLQYVWYKRQFKQRLIELIKVNKDFDNTGCAESNEVTGDSRQKAKAFVENLWWSMCRWRRAVNNSPSSIKEVLVHLKNAVLYGQNSPQKSELQSVEMFNQGSLQQWQDWYLEQFLDSGKGQQTQTEQIEVVKLVIQDLTVFCYKNRHLNSSLQQKTALCRLVVKWLECL